MKLTDSQAKYLRGRGHKLKPVIVVGDAGLTASLLAEFSSTIDHHELIKVRIRAGDRETRDAIIKDLCKRESAELVTRIGNVALMYRPNSDKPKLLLPAR